MTPKLNLLVNKEVKEILKSQQREKEGSIKWTTSLAINFEQGLSPNSNKTHSQSNSHKLYKKYKKVHLLNKNEPKEQNLTTELSLMSRRLSCNMMNATSIFSMILF